MSDNRGTKYELRVLGGLSIEADGAPWNGSGAQRKALALLALLSSAGDRGVSRDKLSAFLWPESDKEQARNALSQLLFRVRRELGPDAVLGNAVMRLNSARVSSDGSEFEAAIASGALERACEIYTGRFLDGFHLGGSSEFHHWMDQEAARLEHQFHVALETLGQAASAAGDATRAAIWWRRRSLAEPLSARAARCYIESLVAAGDRETALRFAASYASLVRQELEAEPDPEVMRLVDRIRRSDATPRPSAGDRVPPSLPVATAEPGSPTSVPSGAAATPPTSVAARGDAPLPGLSPPPDAIVRHAASRGRTRRLWYVSLGAIVVLATALAIRESRSRSPGRPHVVAVLPFENASGDSALDALGPVLASSVLRTIAGSTRVIDVAAAQAPGAMAQSRLRSDAGRRAARDAGATLIVHGSIRRVAGDLAVLASLTPGDAGHAGRTLAPIHAHSSRPDALVESVRLSVAGAVMALVNPRASELSTAADLPRYDAYLHYVEAVEHLVRGSTGQAMASFRQAATVDTNFAAPTLLMLENYPRLWDSLAPTLEARRMRLSERDQLDLAALTARKRGDLWAYYDLARRVVAIVPGEPLALYRLGYAAIGTNRYEAAVEALHEMRRHPGWPNDMYSSWQLDLQAHHLLGDLAGAISEWEQVYARLSNDFVVCTWGVRQYAASGRSDMVDSVVAKCGAPVDAPADLRRLGRRIEVEDELYRWAGREALWHGHTADGRRMLQRAFQLERSLFAKDSTANNGWLAADLAGDWPKAYDLMNASFASGLLRESPCTPSDRRIICIHQNRVRYAVAAAHVGDTLSANHVLAGLEATPRNATFDVDRAKILLALGRRDEAIRLLRDAVRSTAPANWHSQTTFLALRGDKWFEALVAPRR